VNPAARNWSCPPMRIAWRNGSLPRMTYTRMPYNGYSPPKRTRVTKPWSGCCTPLVCGSQKRAGCAGGIFTRAATPARLPSSARTDGRERALCRPEVWADYRPAGSRQGGEEPGFPSRSGKRLERGRVRIIIRRAGGSVNYRMDHPHLAPRVRHCKRKNQSCAGETAASC
jgi:hypothetical protein